jgi:hypothetical protein
MTCRIDRSFRSHTARRKAVRRTDRCVRSLFATPVLAADIPLKAPPIVLFDWTGFYIGGNAGYSWGNKGSWPEARDQLNSLLSGWSSYFTHGTRVPAYRAIDAHVYDRVRNFLCRRHNVSRRGTSRFSFGDVFGELAVLHLMRARNGRPPWVVR